MCGIVGFIDAAGRSEDETSRIAAGMADAVRYRGPDDHGVWHERVSDERSVALGHRRLSIIDLSQEGHQPKLSASGRWVVSYNGEIYNFQDLRAELERAGHRFRGSSDTEVMLAAFDEWGVADALSRLSGMFAFGAWDRRERALWLARDRLGIKPLYYGRAGNSFLFGSELRSFHAHPDFQPVIDPEALSLYFKFMWVPAPHAIFAGVHKLAPGAYLRVDAASGAERGDRYWSLAEVHARARAEPFEGSREEALDTLDRLVLDAVHSHRVSDVPIGALLSGGIDSTAVVAALASEGGGDVRTFTIGFDIAAVDEAKAAARVAAHLGTRHTELYATSREAIELAPRVAEMYDEPFADSSQIPTFLVSKLAREHVTVALSGDGGDEQFAGYDRHAVGERVWGTARRIPAFLRSPAGGLLSRVPLHGPLGGGALGRRGPLLTQKLRTAGRLLGAADIGAMWSDMLSIWSAPQRDLGLRPPPKLPADLTDGATPLRALMALDAAYYLPDDVLAKVDRASMQVSLEVRVPLLDHRVVEFTATLPEPYLRDGGVRKKLLREVVYRRVPRELVDRPKQGFAIPLAAWLRGPLRDWAEPLLEARALEDAGLRPAAVRRLWRDHVSERRDWGHHLWTVLMYQSWRRGLS